MYNFLREKLCPACGAKLKRMPTKEQVKETLISFAEDKGYIFWAIAYLVSLWVISFFEAIFWKGVLFEYISNHWFRTLFLSVFSGSIIDYYAKANVEVTSVRNKFIFRPPIYLRNYRNLTNFGLVAGIGFSIYILIKWPGYVSVLPVLTFITSFILCLVWSIMGIFLTEDHMNDKRIRYFMTEMRVEKVRIYNRVSAIYIGALFVAVVAYCWMVNVSGLWWYIYNSRLVYNFVKFFRDYFGWVKAFTD
jgi:hypothetical protein